MRRALYIGRFQIFHLGHLDVLRTMDAAADVDALVIAVGSAQYDHTRRHPSAPWSVNPFTVEERLEMIRRSLEGELSRAWSVHPVPDLHDWDAWYRHLQEHLPPCEVLYSSDARERAFFAARGHEAREFPRRYSFHAGSIRLAIADGQEYRSALPAGTLAVLDRVGARRRLGELLLRDQQERWSEGAAPAPSRRTGGGR